MKIIDDMLARIPLKEVELKTSLPSPQVIERLKVGLMPVLIKRNREEYFTFEGSYNGFYMKIRCHLHDREGKHEFQQTGFISMLFFVLPIRLDTSPTFYGWITDDEKGSIIRGHFGLPYPIVTLLIAMAAIWITMSFPILEKLTFIVVFFSLFMSITSIIGFIVERKAIIDFLKGLFFDVIRKEK